MDIADYRTATHYSNALSLSHSLSLSLTHTHTHTHTVLMLKYHVEIVRNLENMHSGAVLHAFTVE